MIAASMALGAAGCGDGAEGTILVLAASSLRPVLDELVPAYEAREAGEAREPWTHEAPGAGPVPGSSVTIVYGATGSLAAQIRHGVPADLVLGADEAIVDALIAGGWIAPDSRRVYATGRLAVVVPPGTAPPAQFRSLADPRFRVIALGNPEHAPYGAAGRDALQAAGIWDAVEGRIVLTESIAHAVQTVRTSNADAALVAAGLARGPGAASLPHLSVDPSLHRPIRHVAGVVSGSTQVERARAFLGFLLSAEGREILRRHGFDER